jgi:long-subunit fatty acid transport protein
LYVTAKVLTGTALSEKLGPVEPGNETRRWLSFKSNVKVLTLVVNGKTYHGNSRVGQVSETGIGLFIPANLRIRDNAQIEFSLPDSAETIKTKAVVKDRAGFRYVFEFTDLSELQREKIRRACQLTA